MEPLGASWVVLGFPFFTLVFGVVVKSALGAVSLGFCFDFNGFGGDFGKVLAGIFEDSERFCAILGSLGFSLLLLAIACFWFVLACFCVLLFAFAYCYSAGV